MLEPPDLSRVGMLFLAAVALLGGSPHAHADGTLDPNFGIGGIATVDFMAGNDDAYGLAVQPDGKIIVVGFADPPLPNDAYDSAVARLLPNGALDGTFASGGKTTFTIGPESHEIAVSVAVDTSGRIVLAVYALKGTDDFIVVRLLGDGSLDPGFGTKGVAVLPLPGLDAAFKVVALPDGSVLALGGHIPSTDCIVAKLTPAGTLDTSFGTDGRAFVDFGMTGSACSCMAVDAQGRVVLARGNFGGQDVVLTRLTASGLLDATFGTAGVVISDLGGIETVRAVVVHPNDSIVVGGTRMADGDEDFLFARYLAGGGLDPSFGTGGWTRIDFGGTGRLDRLVDAVVQPDGKVLGVGSSSVRGGY